MTAHCPLCARGAPVTGVGFTGTQAGMTHAQGMGVRHVLAFLIDGEIDAHHGDCIGADADFHKICRDTPKVVWITGHPPTNPVKRAWCQFDSEWPALPYLARNGRIVAATDVLIATPREYEEQLKSGTWSTVRKARVAKKPIHLVYPDGSIVTEDFRVHP